MRRNGTGMGMRNLFRSTKLVDPNCSASVRFVRSSSMGRLTIALCLSIPVMMIGFISMVGEYHHQTLHIQLKSFHHSFSKHPFRIPLSWDSRSIIVSSFLFVVKATTKTIQLPCKFVPAEVLKWKDSGICTLDTTFDFSLPGCDFII